MSTKPLHLRTALALSILAGLVAVLLTQQRVLVAGEAPALLPAALSAGMLTTSESGADAYAQLSPLLDAQQRKLVAEGKLFYDTKWAFYWFEQGLWGRGPTSNAEACATCHRGNGRGAPPLAGEPALSMVAQISLPGAGAQGGPRPHPDYGTQLQGTGVPRLIAAEASVTVNWRVRAVQFADGETVELREPQVQLANLAYGPLGAEVLLSLRRAPAVIGMGLLDAVSDDSLIALAQRPPTDGVQGRINQVWDVQRQRKTPGRFGLKANQPNLRQQVAMAFLEDMGLSSELFPEQNCPGVQERCREMMVAGKPEITAYRLQAVEELLRYTAVPARRDVDDPAVLRGEAVFERARCALCHLPELTTGEVAGQPALSGQVIRPYTDLLLHDMGEELADQRPDFEASGRDWRTAPLWGIGLSETVNGNGNFLHDGRAQNFTEAILWHGGEAAVAREAFRTMPREEREALLRFLQSL